jgi:hypothetical protein
MPAETPPLNNTRMNHGMAVQTLPGGIGDLSRGGLGSCQGQQAQNQTTTRNLTDEADHFGHSFPVKGRVNGGRFVPVSDISPPEKGSRPANPVGIFKKIRVEEIRIS